MAKRNLMGVEFAAGGDFDLYFSSIVTPLPQDQIYVRRHHLGPITVFTRRSFTTPKDRLNVVGLRKEFAVIRTSKL